MGIFDARKNNIFFAKNFLIVLYLLLNSSKNIKKQEKKLISVEAIITLTNTKHSLQEFDFDQPICMAAICYSDPIWIIFSKIATLSSTIIHANFFVDIL